VGSQAAQPAGERSPAQRLTRVEWLFHSVAIVGIAIQVVTAFGSKLVFGEFTGWALLVHMIGAPLVIVGLTGTVLIWAERCRLGAATSGGLRFDQKLMFWIATVAGVATVSPMLAAMLPVFGYAAQDTLKDIHGTSAIVLVVVMVVHTVVSLRARGAKR
jgi:hypothetical protein